MARVRDVPTVIRTVGLFGFAKRIWAQINEDNVLTWASALAYSWLFAIFPFVLFLLTLIPYLPAEWKKDAKFQIAVVVYQLPKQSADTVWGNIEPQIDRLLMKKAGGISIISIVLTLWAASGGVATTMAALDKCYDVEGSRPIYHARPLAAGITLIEIVLILVVLVLIPIGTIVTRRAEKMVAEMVVSVQSMTAATHPASQPATAPGEGESSGPAAGVHEQDTAHPARTSWARRFFSLLFIWQVFRYALGVGLLLMAVAVIYYFGPNIRQRWRWVTPGSIFCVVVWLALGAVFRLYVDKYATQGYDRTYGTVGGVVILLLFFYIDAVILLVGAEINSEIDFVALNLKPGARDFRGTPWEHFEQAAPAAVAATITSDPARGDT